MPYFITNIEDETLRNQYYRTVLFTAKHSQLVLMNLQPGEEIGMEVHELDQFIRFESGSGTVVLDGREYQVSDGTAVVIPAGTKHNVMNTSTAEALKRYSIYSPPEHKTGTVHATKQKPMRIPITISTAAPRCDGASGERGIARVHRRTHADVMPHIENIRAVTSATQGCEECLKTGGSWVQLRLCLSCGHMGCCDSSPNKHATKHYRQTTHPIIQAFQSGDSWRWRYVDQLYYMSKRGTGIAPTWIRRA